MSAGLSQGPSHPESPPSGLVVGEDGRARPLWATRAADLQAYYAREWGMPVRDERGVFERLSLEVFQAGLSWATILRKRPALREAFSDFEPDAVSSLSVQDVETLMTNRRIIRNRAKIRATIGNARATVALRQASSGARDLAALVWSFQPAETPAPRSLEEVPSRSAESTAMAAELRRLGFTFVGPTTCFALMEAIGIVDTHLVGSHRRGSSGVWRDPVARRVPEVTDRMRQAGDPRSAHGRSSDGDHGQRA